MGNFDSTPVHSRRLSELVDQELKRADSGGHDLEELEKALTNLIRLCQDSNKACDYLIDQAPTSVASLVGFSLQMYPR